MNSIKSVGNALFNFLVSLQILSLYRNILEFEDNGKLYVNKALFFL